MIISREIQFDYGHTLPSHYGFCNQLHGHRGKVVAFFSGDIIDDTTSSENGMVTDFSVLKDILHVAVKDKIDHAFAIWGDEWEDTIDLELNEDNSRGFPPNIKKVRISTRAFVEARNTKVLVLDKPPTAEVLGTWAYQQIKKEIENRKLSIELNSIHWYETPNNFAVINEA